MLHIGCHLSASNGFVAMANEALDLKADTFAFFTRNPQGGKAKKIDLNDIKKFLEIAEKNNFVKLVAHAPYTMNLCAAKENLKTFAHDVLADDIRRMEFLPGNYYNFHPGNHVGQGSETGIKIIAEQLNSVLTPEQTTTVLLETMAGKGTEIGRNFEELRAIIDKVELNEKLGVCLDTCHIWDGGYNIVENLDEVLNEFDKIIGLERLKAIHLNDSLNPLNSHKDRHAKIGEGHIGFDAIKKIINHQKLRELPFILETPNDHEGYKREIELLRKNFWTSFFLTSPIKGD